MSVGRLGLGEAAIAMSREDVGDIEVGQEVLLHPASSAFITQLPRRRFSGGRRLTVEFRPNPEQPPIEIDIQLPVLRVHRPHRRGCEGIARFEHAQGQAIEGSVSIFGIGGGGGRTLKLRVREDYPADTACTEWFMPGKLTFRFGWTFVDGTEVGYGMRGDIEETSHDIIEQAIPASEDGCQIPSDDLPREQWLDDRLDRRRTPSKAASWKGWEVAQETTGKLSLGLALGSKVPAKLSLDFLRTFGAKREVGANLAPGARYVAYYPASDNTFEICWTTR